MSLFISISSAFLIAFLLFKNRKYTIPFDKIAVCIILFELIATFITALISLYLEAPLNFFLTPGTHAYVIFENLITVAPIEEFAKFFVIYLATSYLTKLRHPRDLLPYFILSACTFAALENSLYVWVYHMDLTLAIMRCLISTPCHIVYACVFGFFYMLYLEDRAANKFLIAQGLFFASLFHGFMNICLGYYDYTQRLLGIGLGFLILAMYYIIGFLIVHSHFNRPYCACCDNISEVYTPFCLYCGLPIKTPCTKPLIFISALIIGIFLLLLIIPL